MSEGAIPYAAARGGHVAHAALQHQFDNLEQQREASSLGMWVFLATEILFFGGLFMTYLIYRGWYYDAFGSASEHLDVVLGTVNTIVLILSSLTMALAVRASQEGLRKTTVVFLLITMTLGLVFLGIKGYEYYQKFVEQFVPGPSFRFEGADPHHAEIFFSLYFLMTGLHALHMVIGFGLLATMAVLAWRGHFSAEYHNPMEVSGLYWHFVDIVWIFLFPLLYLVARHH